MPSMKTLFSYLRYRLNLICLHLFSMAIVATTLYIAGEGWRYAPYLAFLTSFVLVIYLLLDGRRFCKRRAALRGALEALTDFQWDLPEPANAIEADYTRLIAALYEQIDRAKDHLNRAHSESVDYYTLWVHQIKTPISALRLILREQGAEDKAIAQELFKIERYAELALQYIRLSDLANDLVLKTCDLNDLIRASVRKYAPLFVYNKLKVEVQPIPFRANTDAKWFCFILEQVLSNAVKYTERGGVKIYGEARCVVVEDSGIGIRPEDLPRVFEKGYTGFNGRLEGRASGIGLYLAKRAAAALSIDLRIASEPGRGTRVSMAFGQVDEQMFVE